MLLTGLKKIYSSTIGRYFLAMGFGLFISVLLNDIPPFSEKLELWMSSLPYNQWLTKMTFCHLKLFGAPVNLNGSSITVGERSFYFAQGCLGLRHISLFCGFMIIYFGRWYKKLIYCLVGFLVLTIANVSRATVIGLAIWINPTWFDNVHEYGTMMLFYVTIFLLWVIWSKKVRGV